MRQECSQTNQENPRRVRPVQENRNIVSDDYWEIDIPNVQYFSEFGIENFVAQNQSLELDDLALKEEETQKSDDSGTNAVFPCQEKIFGGEWTQEQQLLINLYQLVDRNNYMISSLNKVTVQQLSFQMHILNKLRKLLNFENSPNNLQQISDYTSHNRLPKQIKVEKNQEALLSQLFGAKKIYSIFKGNIYKERNFTIGVKLVDSNQNITRNTNLLTLCLAFQSNDAEWIHENRVCDPLMKGKTQIELYKGKALFEKIHARELSKIYPQGKVILVIYAKPSNIKYSSFTLPAQFIRSDQIKPLIIENVSIRAKKKE